MTTLLHKGRALGRYFLRPRVLANSAWLSLRHQPDQWWRFPLAAAASSRVVRHPRARLRVHGRALLGYQALLPRDRYFGESGVSGALLWLAGEGSQLTIADGVLIGVGVQLAVAAGARLSIGARTFINPNSRIFCGQDIAIGSDCAISWDVEILDFDAHEIGFGGHFSSQSADVRIGDHVWIGTRAIVLKGVEIGDGAIIGAGSVVTRSIPPRALAVGNPARVVREDVDWRHVPADGATSASEDAVLHAPA